MNLIGAVSDIPKLYTAFAEWSSTMLFLLLCTSHQQFRARSTVTSAVALFALCVLQVSIGIAPVMLWPLGMAAAFTILVLSVHLISEFTWTTSTYWAARAFMLAEFVASLEWQLYYYLTHEYRWPTSWPVQLGLLLTVYGTIFLLCFLLEHRHDRNPPTVGGQELTVTAIIACATFMLSNLSYVASSTPFTSTIGTEVFNIRTLVGLGGVAFLYAFHLQLCDNHTRQELASMRNLLDMQYAQYQQSKHSIDMVNRKYHDLKQQITVLRNEGNPDKRSHYLDYIEQGIENYDAQFKTGNAVLDTMLTSKSFDCQRDHIELTCVADGRALHQVREMDICTMFGNALDNAIEYERTVTDQSHRLIHVRVSTESGFTLICIENYLSDPINISHDLPTTTKHDRDNHGYGLKSIKRTAQDYGGTLTINARHHWFELTILLPQ